MYGKISAIATDGARSLSHRDHEPAHPQPMQAQSPMKWIRVSALLTDPFRGFGLAHMQLAVVVRGTTELGRSFIYFLILYWPVVGRPEADDRPGCTDLEETP